jgi:hypothetical protein
MKVYVQKQMMSVKSRHHLLLFYKISIPIYAFLPVLQNLKDAFVVEVHFQLFVTRFAQLPGLPHQSCSGDLSGDISRAQINGSLRGSNLDCRMDGRAVSSHSFELSARSDVQWEASHCHVEG